MRNAWHITVASIYWSVSLCQDCLKHFTCTNSSNPILLFITCHYLFPYYKWGDWDTEGVMCPRSHSIQTIETIIQTKAVNMETFFQGAGVVHWVIEALTSLSWSWEILACFLYIVDTWVIVFWGRFFSCCPHLGKFLSGEVTKTAGGCGWWLWGRELSFRCLYKEVNYSQDRGWGEVGGNEGVTFMGC